MNLHNLESYHKFERSDWNAPYSPLNRIGRFQQHRMMIVLSSALQRMNMRLDEVDTLLDLGCGQGAWLNTLADIRGDSKGLYGLDISEERLAVARRLNPGIEYLVGDMLSLPYESHTFELITTFASLMFLSGDAQMNMAFKEMARVLKPGCYLLLFEPCVLGSTPATIAVRPDLISEHVDAAGLEVEFMIPYFRRIGGYSTASLVRRVPELVCQMLEACRFLPSSNCLYAITTR